MIESPFWIYFVLGLLGALLAGAVVLGVLMHLRRPKAPGHPPMRRIWADPLALLFFIAGGSVYIERFGLPPVFEGKLGFANVFTPLCFLAGLVLMLWNHWNDRDAWRR